MLINIIAHSNFNLKTKILNIFIKSINTPIASIMIFDKLNINILKK